MKTTTRESIAIFLAGMLLLSSFTTPAKACCDPPAPPCYRCEAGVWVWDCGSGENCCNGSCCPNRCCNDVCCSCSAAECCGSDRVCCYNSCCDLTCCEDPEEHCCGGNCCSNACCNSTCCDPGESCCGPLCCMSGCCSVTGGCCGNIGKECCDGRTCYDPDTEKCCGNGEGTVCDKAGGECCDESGCVTTCPGSECCDDGTCVSSCPTGQCCDDGVCVGITECSGDTCCDEGVCVALKGCESCIDGEVEDDKSKCTGECNNCIDAVCDDDNALCDPGDVCVDGTCCDTASAGDCVVTDEDLDYSPENCLPQPGGQCKGGPGYHVAFGWEQTSTHQHQTGPGTVDISGCADVIYARCFTVWTAPFFECLLDEEAGNITENFGTHDECPSE
jgi:hypothetical protein